MTQAPDFTLNHGENGDTLALTGSLLVSTVGMLDRRLRAVEAPVATLDLGGVTAIDTVGAWVCGGCERWPIPAQSWSMPMTSPPA